MDLHKSGIDEREPASYYPHRSRKGTHGAVVQVVRIPACHAGGRGFEARPFRQITEALTAMSGLFCFYAVQSPCIIIIPRYYLSYHFDNAL